MKNAIQLEKTQKNAINSKEKKGSEDKKVIHEIKKNISNFCFRRKQ